MKRSALSILASLCLVLSGCGGAAAPVETSQVTESTVSETVSAQQTQATRQETYLAIPKDAMTITLSDDGITTDAPDTAVHTANDIVYYESGHDFTYGEGTQADAHTAEEAAAHTVVHITAPGTYILRGQLSAGQIAVELGEDAKDDPNAVVTLVLDGVDITCTVAPAVIFYQVYECGPESDEGGDVDLSAAGARVILADGSENIIHGSYVARIYKSFTLSEDGTQVTDSKKLHKYDGAFYSKMSMAIYGESENCGNLTIYGENEGLDTELHLTQYSGNITIFSGNDGINTNEDGISVTSILGGNLSITVTGETGEGDGIDSNGYLIIDGGHVTACACSDSADSGIDADNAIVIRSGTVIAAGNMLDQIDEGQTYVVLTFGSRQSGGPYTLKNAQGQTVLECAPANRFTYLVLSTDTLEPGDYTLWQGDTQLTAAKSEGTSGFGGPQGGQRPDAMGQPPEGMERPDGTEPSRPDGDQRPDGTMGEPPQLPDGEVPGDPPTDKDRGDRPQGMDGKNPGDRGFQSTGEQSQTLTITQGSNFFSVG